MFHRGMKVRIGGRRADVFAYTAIVGHVGTIEEVKDGYVTVHIDEGDYGNWYVQDIDCLPFVIKNNKTATILLEKEW